MTYDNAARFSGTLKFPVEAKTGQSSTYARVVIGYEREGRGGTVDLIAFGDVANSLNGAPAGTPITATATVWRKKRDDGKWQQSLVIQEANIGAASHVPPATAKAPPAPTIRTAVGKVVAPPARAAAQPTIGDGDIPF